MKQEIKATQSYESNNLLHSCELTDANIANILKEWEILLNTQMHFNDLIIKYRTAIVSLIVTLGGVLIALSKKEPSWITSRDLELIGILLGAFWVFAFLIDFFYYHQLLLGAVDHADKFDLDSKAKDLGLFGLTASIKKRVSIKTSKMMIAFFYLGPLIVGLLAYLIIP
jgi:hypothetical protein